MQLATIIDLAKSLNGKSTRKASVASGNASGVRYGTATAATDKTVTVKLDGSDETVTLNTDAGVAAGNRVRVVAQGGSYAVVALEGIATASADAAEAKEQAASASKAAGDASTAAAEAKSAADAAKADASAVKTTVKEVSDSLDSFKTTVADTYATNDGVTTTLKEYSTVTQTAEAVEAKFSQAVTAVVTQYAAGSSATAAPTSGWSTATPTWSSGKYIWQRTVTTVNGKQTVGNATCIQGAKGEDGAQGEKGEDGAAGNGIKKATPQYYLSTSKTAATGGSWATAPQTYVAGRYYWTRTAYTWTASTSTTYSTAVYDPSLTAALAGVTGLETLVRATTDGLEVAKMSDGAYVGTRAVLDSDSLDFVSQDGKTTYASFATDGLHFVDARAGMTANDITLDTGDQSKTTVLGVKLTAPYLMLNSTEHNVNLWSSSTDSSGVAHSATLGVGANSGYYLPNDKTVFASTKSGSSKLDITARGDTLNVFSSDGTGNNSATVEITSGGLRGDGKAVVNSYSVKVLGGASSSPTCAAYRHFGWVVVAFNNYICPTAAPNNYVVGTLPAGWRPPMMMKGSLFAGSVEVLGYDGVSDVFADYAAMVNVTTAGQVRVYSPGLPAGTKLSGYVIYPATQ